MGTRLQLQAEFERILGTRNVYFQPPSSLVMKYPAIVYHIAKMDAQYANNKKYARLARYQVTTIQADPDGILLMDIFNMPKCTHVRHFAVDGLNHDIFDLYY